MGLEFSVNGTTESQLINSRSSVGGKGFCSLFTGEACEKGMYDKSAPHGINKVRELFQPDISVSGTTETEKTKSNAEELNKYTIDAQSAEPASRSPKKIMSDSKSIPIDNGMCENSRDPVAVCINYDSCCTASDNCVCQNPVNKDCQSLYKDCLEGKYLSESNMDYISAEKKDVICKKIKTNCCKSVLYTKNAKNADYKNVTMSMPDTYSTSLCNFSGNEVTAIAACKQSCNLNDKCQSVIYNKGMGRCDIYDKPLITKPGFLKNDTDAETIQFQRAGSNLTNITTPNNSEGFLSAVSGLAEEYCYSEGIGEQVNGGEKSCYKKNGIVTDCRKQFDKCLNRSIPGLSMAKKKEHCANMFGACCSIVDGLDVVDRFKFLGVEVGAGNPKDKLCSWTASSLDECKTKCLQDPNCQYIYSNLGSPNITENEVKRCELYSGKPVKGFIPTFSKEDVSGKFVYRKAEVNTDDEFNTTTTNA
jgi:hypothetical protein